MNDFTAITHQTMQANVDEYIRAGLRPRSLAEHRVEREICYADYLKAIVDRQTLLPDCHEAQGSERQPPSWLGYRTTGVDEFGDGAALGGSDG